MSCHPTGCVFCGPVNISLMACGSPLMCSIFSACSKRCSVSMMSMISCNLLLALFGAASSTVRFHPLGVLSNGVTLPVSILSANVRSGPKQTNCSCFVLGLTAIRGLRTSACQHSMVIHLPSVSLNTSKRRPRPTQQTCQQWSTVLRLQRPRDICTLVLLEALQAPLSCALPCRFQT